MESVTPGNPKCKLPYCKKCEGVYKILAFVVLVIFVYAIFLAVVYGQNKTQKDFMNVKVFDMPSLENCCSLWPLSHLILFFILGFLYPDCGILIISLGIGWELFEMLLAGATRTNRQYVRSSSKIEYSENWWAGSFKDIVMNVVGYAAGATLAKISRRS